MLEKETESMLEKMKRGIKMFSFSAEVKKNPISGMNLSARLARVDCAYENLTLLFKSKLFMLDDHKRAEYYLRGLKLLDVVISNLNYIHAEKGQMKMEDPCLPIFITIRKMLELLNISAEASIEMEKNERNSENFGGPLAIAKLRIVGDSVGDMEISLLHSVAELFDILSLSMQKNTELRRKQLSKEEQERYLKSHREFSLYYSKLCEIQ